MKNTIYRRVRVPRDPVMNAPLNRWRCFDATAEIAKERAAAGATMS
jgi:hypothetical protein